jgi:hypothetical protein
MRIAVALALGALVGLGCSKPANKKLDELADRACACKDHECAKKVGDDYAAWRKEYEGASGDPTQAERARARLTSCLMSVGGGKAVEKPSQPGDAAGQPPGGAEKPEGKPADGSGTAGTGGKADQGSAKPADKATDKADRASDKPADK